MAGSRTSFSFFLHTRTHARTHYRDVDKVDDLIDDIREEMDTATHISDAISTPLDSSMQSDVSAAHSSQLTARPNPTHVAHHSTSLDQPTHPPETHDRRTC